MKIIGEAGRDSAHRRRVLCLCVCGNEFAADAWKVNNGWTKSCGCLKPGIISAARTTHGQARPQTGEYRSWYLMKNRCLNPKDKRYDRYGGRGIAVHPEWLNSFEAFFAYMGKRPTAKHSIDRYPNYDGNYEPGNVRWATPVEQRRNQERYKNDHAGL
jgi:hypothetical protein